MLRTRLLATALALCPSVAFAAGLDLPENGALVLARGGTTAGILDTAYAVAFNPAGLSLIDGLDVRLDYRFVNHEVTFERIDDNLGFDPAVNTAGVFAAPFVSIAYGTELSFGRVGFGVGAFGPAGVGKYKYADPADAQYESARNEQINEETGHRYATLGSESLIMYPSVAASYSPSFIKSLSLGVTFQAVYADISLRQSMAGLPHVEGVGTDVLIGIDVKDSFTPTAVMGALWSPMENVRVHASFRPKVSIHATGDLDLALGDDIKDMVTVGGAKTTELDIALPPLARVGAAFDHEYFSASAEFIYEGWSANKQFTLTPNVEVAMAGEGSKPLDPVLIEKNWKDSFGGRLGGTFKALRPAQKGDLFVDVHAGGLYETNAIPSETQSLDYVTGDRLGGSLGFTVGYKGFAITAAGMAYVPVKMEITDSKVLRAEADADAPPIVVGNGTYTSNAWVAAVGLSYTGLGSDK